jgi:hypothetical protein
MVVRLRYSEPKFNQQSGSIVRGVPKDWNEHPQCEWGSKTKFSTLHILPLDWTSDQWMSIYWR